MNALRRLAAGVARLRFGGIGTILCFHRILPEDERSAYPANRALEITPRHLREILAWVRARGLEPIAIGDVPARLAQPRSGKFIVFTFDDGYRDNLTHAAPIFREAKIPWTLFIAPGLIDGSAPAWWYEIEGALAARERLEFTWAGERRSLPARTMEDREQSFDALAALIRAQGLEKRDACVETICAAAGLDACAREAPPMLTWREARELAADPLVTIGAHTTHHHTLRLLREAEVRDELLGSREALTRLVGVEARHLAYPFGGRNAVGAREFAIARECGFATAATTRGANLFAAHREHLHALPRIGVSGNYAPADRLAVLESGALAAREFGWQRVVSS